MDEKAMCPYCNRNNVIKRGFRKLKTGGKQRYFCKDCCHKFSLGLGKKRFDVKIILNAVCYHNQGYSYEEICGIISRKHKISAGVSSVFRWVKEYDLGYSRIRLRIMKNQKNPFITGRIFKHSGLLYNFKCHRGKLLEFGKFPSLKEFVLNLTRGVEEEYFSNSCERCSQTNKEVSVDIKVLDNTRLNKVAGSILKIVRSNKQRHSVIENLMLNCDRDTVAVEVPIWYWDKAQNVGVCGHIDVLQVKYGKIWVLDYKPSAEEENIDKVVSQLFSYALGLSFRTGIKMRDVRCGWFDENKMYVFDAGVDAVWDNISWSEILPTDGETVPNGNTVLLFHMNNDSSHEENDTFIYDFSSNGNNGTAIHALFFDKEQVQGKVIREKRASVRTKREE